MTISPANIPNAFIGIKGLKKLAKKATAVVLEVKAMALSDLLKVYAILALLSPFFIIVGSILSLYRHASMNTKMSSAEIPRTRKIMSICNVLK